MTDLSDEAADRFILKHYNQGRAVSAQELAQEWRRRAEILIAAADERGFERGCGEGAKVDFESFKKILEKERRKVVEFTLKQIFTEWSETSCKEWAERFVKEFVEERKKEKESI